MKSARALSARMKKLGSARQATELQRFFKTGPGDYGEGDVFLGLKVPQVRALVKEFHDLPLAETKKLLKSGIHEERLFALLVMVRRAEKGDPAEKKRMYDLYLKNTRYVNNWDLVDLSSHHIVGGYLMERSRRPLHRLAKSKDLWERRIAIVTTAHFIQHNDFADTLKIAEILLHDEHDLIHKAVGWMLREVGKRDRAVEEKFLKKHYRDMPRTMLRYAIERFPEPLRQRYLKGTV
ncbi:DNA alkylation repair protein [Planctomycetota bacterium]